MKIYIRIHERKSERFDDVTEVKRTANEVVIRQKGRKDPITFPNDLAREIVLFDFATA